MSKRSSGASGSASKERLWSIQVINENGRERRTMVPYPWVDSMNNCIYWPPKKGKPLGCYLTKWCLPGEDWVSFDIIETYYECGTKEEVDAMMRIPTTTEASASEGEDPQPPKTSVRVLSPVLRKKFKPIVSSDEESDSTSIDNNRSTPIVKRNTSVAQDIQLPTQDGAKNLSPVSFERQDYQPSTSFGQRILTKSTAKLGDGGNKFKEMSTKQFQYVILMELRSIKETVKLMMERMETIEQSNESQSSNSGTVVYLKPCQNMTEVQQEEKKLGSQSYMKLKIKQLRSLGGKDPRSRVRRALDETMSRQVQNQYSKDGLTGKMPYIKTNHYKCLIGALVDVEKPELSKSSIDFLISDLLKRALPKNQKQKQEAQQNQSNADVEEPTLQ